MHILFINTRLLQVFSIKLLGVIFFILFSNFAHSQNRDSTKFHNQIIGLSFNAVRLPYGSDSAGNIIPYYLYASKFDYSYKLNPYFELKSGFTLYTSNLIFNDKKYMMNFDIMGIGRYRKLHVDLGFHIGNFTMEIPPIKPNGPLAQYLSIGAGFTLPFGNKWAFDFSIRNSFNVTIKENSYGNIPEGFVGIQYNIIGNNNYLRKSKKSS
jgi:hypothetical protein